MLCAICHTPWNEVVRLSSVCMGGGLDIVNKKKYLLGDQICTVSGFISPILPVILYVNLHTTLYVVPFV